MGLSKKRIMMVTEASFLNTGFATYSRQLLNRLYKTGKYEIAELACYAAASDPRSNSTPWLLFPNMPNNENEAKEYEHNLANHYGAYKFEGACLSFKPDIVFSILDPWMNSYQVYSPFRKYYNLVHMQTVDAVPLLEEWVSDYMQTDAMLSYTSWGGDEIKKATNNRINYVGAAPGGADDAFRPVMDKAAHKAQNGIDPNAFIIGMVARNQIRKLFPQLMKDFRSLLNSLDEKQASRTFLYLHTAYPDLGWDIPRLLNQHQLGHKVLFTYKCKGCKHSFTSLYKDARINCPRCMQSNSSLSHSMDGVSTEELCKIYNLFDMYVQYSNAEGLGIPVIEAAYCGVPVAVVNYSGMCDFVNKLGARPIEPKDYTIDVVTGRQMAVPCSNDFACHAKELMARPASLREAEGLQLRNKAIHHFNWDNALALWEKAFDSLPNKNNWNAPANIHNIPKEIPGNLPPEQMVRWSFTHIAGRTELMNTFMFLSYIRDLNWGVRYHAGHGLYCTDMSVMGLRAQLKEFKLEDFVNEMMAMGHNKNGWERERINAMS